MKETGLEVTVATNSGLRLTRSQHCFIRVALETAVHTTPTSPCKYSQWQTLHTYLPLCDSIVKTTPPFFQASIECSLSGRSGQIPSQIYLKLHLPVWFFFSCVRNTCWLTLALKQGSPSHSLSLDLAVNVTGYRNVGVPASPIELAFRIRHCLLHELLYMCVYVPVVCSVSRLTKTFGLSLSSEPR